MPTADRAVAPGTDLVTDSPAGGLTEAEAASRLATHGYNELPRTSRGWFRRYVVPQALDPLILVLLAASVLTTVTGDLRDTVVILAVVVLNGAVGAQQQLRADQAVAALERLAAPVVRVRRDGRERDLPTREVVPGDLVVLEAGDVVPADGALVAGPGLEVDESSLTGESVAVAKVAGEHAVSAGTLVTRGRGDVVVTATGAASAMGRVATMLHQTRAVATPLQRRLAELGRWLAVGAAAAAGLVLALGLARGQSVELMLVTAVSLAVAAVPESLPAVVTLALALGARRMAARHAVVRRLPSVETLGAVTVLATDKTGTLTEGRMRTASTWQPPGGDPALPGLLACAVLCSTDAGGESRDPTEAALVAAAAESGIGVDELLARFPRVSEVPFDAARRRMTTVHATPEGGALVVSKGAPEMVLGAMPPGPGVTAARAQADEYAADGCRVLAITAGRRDAPPPDPAATVAAEAELGLVGLVALVDPPRAEAKRAMADCRSAGIRPVLITGDHPATARAIASMVTIGDGDPVVAPAAEAGSGGWVDVYARALPEHKLSIVESLQHTGQIVAMTGDGVNDAPALRRADIGVVMGHRGTEVAKQAADVILVDDNLDTLISAVEEGRRVYANIRRFLLYALSGGFAEILVMALGPLVGMPLPLLPAQILWVNLMTHGLPGVAMGAQPGEPDALATPPRPPGESVLGAGLWRQVLVLGSFIGVGTLAAGMAAEQTGAPYQSVVFLTLGLLQLGAGLALRVRGRLVDFLTVAVAGAAALQFLAVYTVIGREALETEWLSPGWLGVSLGVTGAGYVATRLLRRSVRSRR